MLSRRETRQCCGQMVSGLLMELDDHNCQPVAEAVGHRGRSWHRWTAICLLAYIYLAVAVACNASKTPAQTWRPG